MPNEGQVANNNQNIPDPVAIFNMKNKLKLPEKFKPIIHNLVEEGALLGKPYFQKAVETGRKDLENLDSREVSNFAWFLADHPEKFTDDPTYMEYLKYPEVSLDAQEDMMDKFYQKRINTDYRKFDFSCLTGKDTSEKKDGELLSKSEKDFLDFLGGLQSNQNNVSRAKEKPEYYLGLLDRLTPEQRYRMQINCDYEAAAAEPLKTWIQYKEGFTGTWKENPTLRNSYEASLQDADQGFLYASQKFQSMHYVYNFRMAKLENSPNPPKPELAIKIHPRARFMDILSDAEKIRNREELDQWPVGLSKASELIDGLVPFYSHPMDLSAGNVLMRYQNIFIDGVPSTEYFKDDLNDDVYKLNKAEKAQYYDTLIAEVLLSGKHHVECGIRYMNSEHNMDVEYFSVKPDLTAVAEAQRKQYNWFRRTFFDWGPFKIPTVLDEQKKFLAEETDEKRAARIEKIKKADPNRQETIDNPKRTLPKEGMISVEKDRYKMHGVRQYTLDDWVAEKVKIEPLDKAHKARFNENVRELFGGAHNWTVTSAIKYCVSEFGVINTTRLFQKMAKEDPKSAFINADKEMMSNISKVQNGADAATLTDEQVFFKTMDHLLKNGALENENSEMMIHMMKELQLSEEQRKFVETLDFLSSKTKEGENLIHLMAENLEKYPNEEVPKKDYTEIQKYIATKSLNKVFIDTVKEGLKAEDATFDGEYLKTSACQNLMEICTEKQDFYQGILDKVVENTVKEVEGMTVKNALRQVHNKRDQIEDRTKEAINKALHPEVKEPQEIKDKVVEQAEPEINAPVEKQEVPAEQNKAGVNVMGAQ